MPPESVDLCVVVPTFRRPALLAQCLRALIDQTLEATRYEIIVVDDGHDDATQALVQRMAELLPLPRLRYLRPACGRGPAVARNCGWRGSEAPVIAFTDDDTRPDAHWLQHGMRTLATHPAWVAAAGRVEVPQPATAVHRRPTDHELMTRGLETAEFVTANAFVWRAALVSIDGFDERFLRAWREDSDLHFRLQRLGPVGRAPLALVWHPVRPERWGVSLRQQRNVFFDALLYSKHPHQYRERIRRLPPWDYYVIVALAAAAPLLALASNTPAAGAALLGAAILILRLTLRRLRPTSHAPAHVWEMLITSAAIPFLSVYWRLRGAWHFRTPFL
jgi:glycosyltransferase involved in cell wall biosynthesis